MGHYKTQGQEGVHEYVAEGNSLSQKGNELELAATEVLETEVKSGIVNISANDGTNDQSATFSVNIADSVATTNLIGANTLFSNTKDNADTINVYIESGVVKVQNSLATAITGVVSSYS